MKKIVISIILLSLSFNTFYSAGIYVWFKINQTSIAEKLCRYKEEANNSCQGCCVLQKKISETTSPINDSVLPNQNNEKPLELFFIKLVTLSNNHNFSNHLTNRKFHFIHFQSYEIINSLFRPPELYK